MICLTGVVYAFSTAIGFGLAADSFCGLARTDEFGKYPERNEGNSDCSDYCRSFGYGIYGFLRCCENLKNRTLTNRLGVEEILPLSFLD